MTTEKQNAANYRIIEQLTKANNQDDGYSRAKDLIEAADALLDMVSDFVETGAPGTGGSVDNMIEARSLIEIVRRDMASMSPIY